MAEDDPNDKVNDIYADAAEKGADVIYRDWAEQYDADNAANGFRLPFIAAAFAARYIPRGAGPILDAGCGTGLVGGALQVLGYDRIDGLDLTPEMLTRADATGAYRNLRRARLGEPLPYGVASYAGVLCIGSFGPGHAPPESLDELLRIACPGAPVIFNLGDTSWDELGFRETIERITAQGLWSEVEISERFRPYTVGEQHLWGRVFVYRKL